MKESSISRSRISRRVGSFFLSCLGCFLCLCLSWAGKKTFVKVFFPSDFSITAELAVTDEERQLGLMFRENIHSDQGMLFIFEEEGVHSFWMKNMKFSIDILWLDREKRIVHFECHVPPCKGLICPSYASKVPAMYVLELKAGSVAENQLRLNDRLEFILPE